MIPFVKKYFLQLLIVICIIVWFVSFFRVPSLFFQQDELYGFGLFILNGPKIILSGLGLHDTVHFVPVTMSISYSIYSLFGLKPEIYNIVGLIFHTINAVILYFLMQRVLGNKYYSLLSVILFFSVSAAAELVMWPVINLNTVSLTFSLLALFWLVKRVQEKGYLKILDSILISALFLLAVFSVEYAAGMIFLIPVAAFILNRKNNFFKKSYSLAPFFIAVCVYLLFRFVPLILFPKAAILVSSSGTVFSKFLWFFSLPLIYIAQIFLGQTILIGISQFISSSFLGNTANTQFAESVIYKYVASLAGVIVIALILWVVKAAKRANIVHWKFLIIFLSFIVFSSFPFVFVPGKGFSIFPSRYLYFGSVGYALIVPIVLYVLRRVKLKREFLVFLILIIVGISFGTYGNFKRSSILYTAGKTRQLILEDVHNDYPELPQKVIFYTISNKSYYGLPDKDKIFPFQSGLGQTFLLWYYKNDNLPVGFFSDNFLWDITSQGYKEIQGRGFGYFRDYSLLVKTLKEYNLTSKSVIAFYWDDNTQALTDITTKIREEINLDVKTHN